MMSQVTSVSNIDRLTAVFMRFLEEMPDVTGCDAHRVAAAEGLRLSPCDDFAVIGDTETENQFCLYHWRKYLAGEMPYLRR